MVHKGVVTRYLYNTPGSGSPASSRIYLQSILSGAASGTAAGGCPYDHHGKTQQKVHDQTLGQGSADGKKSQLSKRFYKG
jgi:hypothetical protein